MKSLFLESYESNCSEAYSAFNKVTEQDVAHKGAWTMKAKILLKQGKIEEAHSAVFRAHLQGLSPLHSLVSASLQQSSSSKSRKGG